MTAFSADDYRYMARALRLARRGLYSAHPNPRVGCVLVRDGVIVGEGWHRAPGEPHAEIRALDAAGERARGAAVYVTLEPCNHHGRTGPCCEALLAAGVARVVAACLDPNPRVAGAGLGVLGEAGVPTDAGLLEPAARELNAGFLSRMERARPFVRVKLGASLDGRTAMRSGESQWITGPAARRDVQRLRAQSGAILTGRGTVTTDNPSLTVREPDLGLRQPLRVVADSALRTPPAARLLGEDGETLFFCVDASHRAPLEAAGAAVVTVPAAAGRVDLRALLTDLAVREINDVLVEAGPELSGAMLDRRLADELVIYQAPHIMGSETRGLVDTPRWLRLAQRVRLDIVDRRQLGDDLRITAVPLYSN